MIVVQMLLLLFSICLVNGNAIPVEKGAPVSPGKMKVTFDDTGKYTLQPETNADHFTLQNADVYFQSAKTLHKSNDGTLKLSSQKDISGSDPTGTYVGKTYNYVTTDASKVQMSAQVLNYNEGEFVVFSQSFPQGLKDCNVSDMENVLSSFPSFLIGNQDSMSDTGYLNLFGDMFGYGYAIHDLKGHPEGIRGGQNSGPLVLFDQNNNVMVISSFSNFMSHYMEYNSTDGVARYGIKGGVTTVPQHYRLETIVYYGNQGINKAVEGWGRTLTEKFHKRRHYMESDFSINYLGYYTDNGAFYYYHTEPNKTYEETLLDVTESTKSAGIPFRYIQYDSWWYYKGVADGVKNWTAMPDIFPNGLNYLFENHNLPVVAHNRYWASDTTYAKNNGGAYDFVIDHNTALPIDTKFWRDLICESKPWGLITYEQDWLDVEYQRLMITHTDIDVARNWLMEMGNGAAGCDVTIQYCMALPRQMMQSVEISSVTQARVSGDYHPGNSQWKIGVTSLFAYSLYIAPFKDTFWSTTIQEGKPEKEPNIDLQVAIATLSTGPVGPGDKVGSTNSQLLMKCCRADGLIIKPSRPITSTDKTIMKHAFTNLPGAANLEAEVFTTYSDLYTYSSAGNFMIRFGIVLVTELTTTNYNFKLQDMYLDQINPAGSEYVAFQGHPNKDMNIYNVSSTMPIPTCGTTDFQLWHVSPVIKSGTGSIALLGERSKFVPVSSRRIPSLEIRNGNMLVVVAGKAGESVTMDFLVNYKVSSITCTLPNSGSIRISVKSAQCMHV